MSPLHSSDAIVDVSKIYDGDVIRHPLNGQVVTVIAAMQLSPIVLVVAPGVLEMGGDGEFLWDGVPDEYEASENEKVFRLFQYRLD